LDFRACTVEPWVEAKVPSPIFITCDALMESHRTNNSVNKPRVLIADDSQVMRELLKAIVRAEGFAVAGEAVDGLSVMGAVLRNEPDIVCLDINMPGRTGLEVLQEIRARAPKVKVVMITSDNSMNSIRVAIGHGAHGYIIKPFNQAKVGKSLWDSLSSDDETSSFS